MGVPQVILIAASAVAALAVGLAPPAVPRPHPWNVSYSDAFNGLTAHRATGQSAPQAGQARASPPPS